MYVLNLDITVAEAHYMAAYRPQYYTAKTSVLF